MLREPIYCTKIVNKSELSYIDPKKKKSINHFGLEIKTN